ncbi:PriCT-2 domain-containing protein [Paraburkholderia sp. SIMBA_053]|uniref:PriCT-2 domain-containing protein n=1 Tax=Paraburkholderia sp. SIMBA_053 TaxID=3085794 RepID=UPI00397DFC1A
MLSWIPADCDRTQWIKIGGALRHEFGEVGLDLFDEWSQRSADQYDARDTLSAWRSLKGGAANPSTFKTIAGMARAAGWVPGQQARKLTPAESEQRARDRAEREARSEAEAVARRAVAASRAVDMLAGGRPYVAADAAKNDYLQRQGLDEGYGAMIGPFSTTNQTPGEISIVSENALLIPMMDMDKKVHSVQAILPDATNPLKRDKTYLAGGDKRGHFFRIGQPKTRNDKHVVLIAEGFATAASLHKSTGHCVFVAFDAGNLKPVAEAVRAKVPTATIVLCADNDRFTAGNPGRTRARQAAAAVGGLVALPEFDGATTGTDFNDLAMLNGAHDDAAVIAVIEAALEANEVVTQAAVDAEWANSKVKQVTNPAREAAPWNDISNAESVAILDAPASDELPGVMFVESVPPKGETIGRPTDNRYFKLLGHDRGTYYVFQNEAKQVKAITKSDFTENGLLELAPPNWWELHFPGAGKQAGINKRAAVNFLIRACVEKGIYDPSNTRGRGAWIDSGRVVFHAGSHLQVNGLRTEVTDIESRFVYEVARDLPALGDDVATDDEGQWVITTAEKFRWEKPASALLVAGWAALAPLCGAIAWRPHIWLTGGAGCGKSTILNQFLAPLASGADDGEDGIALLANGNTSEAGLRQCLKADARPVLFDESESNRERDADRIQAVLSLIRQASTESKFKTLKGTAGGEAMSFHIRSMFCMASIQTALKQQADVERLTVLRLRDKRDNKTGDLAWSDLEIELSKLRGNGDFARRIINRSLRLMPITIKNIRTFVSAAARKFGNQRDGDQYGTLLAGAWSLFSSEMATDEQATDLIESLEWNVYVEPDADDRFDGLKALTSCIVRTDRGDATILELVQIAGGDEVEGLSGFGLPAAERMLGRYGLRRSGNDLQVSNKNDARVELMAKTNFNADLRGQLLRVPGAKPGEKPLYFKGAGTDRYLSVPLAGLFATQDDSATSTF